MPLRGRDDTETRVPLRALQVKTQVVCGDQRLLMTDGQHSCSIASGCMSAVSTPSANRPRQTASA